MITLTILTFVNLSVVYGVIQPESATASENTTSMCGSMDWSISYETGHPACPTGTMACTEPMPDYTTCTYHMWIGDPIIVIEN